LALTQVSAPSAQQFVLQCLKPSSCLGALHRKLLVADLCGAALHHREAHIRHHLLVHCKALINLSDQGLGLAKLCLDRRVPNPCSTKERPMRAILLAAVTVLAFTGGPVSAQTREREPSLSDDAWLLVDVLPAARD
jgi:hypothetical protein